MKINVANLYEIKYNTRKNTIVIKKKKFLQSSTKKANLSHIYKYCV